MKPPVVDYKGMLELTDDQLRANIKAEYDLEDTKENKENIEQCLRFINQFKQMENPKVTGPFSYSYISWRGFLYAANSLYMGSLKLPGWTKPRHGFGLGFGFDIAPLPNEILPISLALNKISCSYTNWREVLIGQKSTNDVGDNEDISNLVYSALAKINENLAFTGKCMFGLPDGTHHPLDCIEIVAEVDTFKFPNTQEAMKCLLFVCTLHALANSNPGTEAKLKKSLKETDPESYALLPSCAILDKNSRIGHKVEKVLAIFSMFYALQDYKRSNYYLCTQALRSSGKAIDLLKQVCNEVKIDSADLLYYLGLKGFHDRVKAVQDDLKGLNVVCYFASFGYHTTIFSLKENAIACFQLAIIQSLLTGNYHSLYIANKGQASKGLMHEQFERSVTFAVCRYMIATESEENLQDICKEMFACKYHINKAEFSKKVLLPSEKMLNNMLSIVLHFSSYINDGFVVFPKSSKYFYKYWLHDVTNTILDKLNHARMDLNSFGYQLTKIFNDANTDYCKRKYIDLTLPKKIN